MPIEFCRICKHGFGSLSQSQLDFNLAAHVATHLQGREGPERQRIIDYYREIEARLSQPRLTVSVS